MGWIVYLGLLVALTAWLLARAARPLNRERLDDWARRHGLELTDAERIEAAAYLRRSRWYRTVGLLVPLLTSLLSGVWWGAVLGRQAPDLFQLLLLLAPGGYLVGAVAAEATWRPEPPAIRAASLAPRRLPDYVPASMVVVPRILAVITVGLAAPVAWLDFRTDLGWEQRPAYALALGLLAMLAVGAVELASRWIVARSQPVRSARALALDDAIRSTSVHSVAAAGLALVLLLLSQQLIDLAGVDLPGAAPIGTVLGVVCFGTAVGAIVHVAHPERWVVRRSGTMAEGGGA